MQAHGTTQPRNDAAKSHWHLSTGTRIDACLALALFGRRFCEASGVSEPVSQSVSRPKEAKQALDGMRFCFGVASCLACCGKRA